MKPTTSVTGVLIVIVRVWARAVRRHHPAADRRRAAAAGGPRPVDVGYVALSRLSAGPSSSQLALAEQMSYDKTRLIAVLDELAALGLVEREPDPTDRRARIVTLTGAGRERLAAARADIRAMEDGLLADLDPAARAGLRATPAGLAPRGTPGDAGRSPPEARRT
jgi:DNA-binding MarR family transcriptional regulator